MEYQDRKQERQSSSGCEVSAGTFELSLYIAREVKQMLLVRRGSVIDEAIAQERANNIATFLTDIVDRLDKGEPLP